MKRVYVLLFLELASRRILFIACSEHPGGAGAAQQGRSLAWQEVRQFLEVVLPRVEWTPEVAIAWYENQQRRKRAARRSHWRRWLREHP